MVVNNNEIIIKGKLLKIAQFKEEWDVDVDDPDM